MARGALYAAVSTFLAPAGASIGLTSGVFTRTPTATHAGWHTFQVVATDDGVPALSAAQAV